MEDQENLQKIAFDLNKPGDCREWMKTIRFDGGGQIEFFQFGADSEPTTIDELTDQQALECAAYLIGDAKMTTEQIASKMTGERLTKDQLDA